MKICQRMFLDSEAFISKPSDVILEFLLRPLFRILIQKPHSYRDNTDEGKGKNEKPTLVARAHLGMKVLSSSKCTAATVIALEKQFAVLLVRRDIITEPFENPKADRYGVVASERIGLGITRTDAVGKMTSI